MIEDGSDDFRLEICPDNLRTTDILIPIIQKHVKVDSIIRTDYWKSYLALPNYGYIHQRVNHSDPENRFFNPDGIHTQRIESSWRPIKDYFRSKAIPDERFADHVVEYQWRRKIKKKKLDAFQELINCIIRQYAL